MRPGDLGKGYECQALTSMQAYGGHGISNFNTSNSNTSTLHFIQIKGKFPHSLSGKIKYCIAQSRCKRR